MTGHTHISRYKSVKDCPYVATLSNNMEEEDMAGTRLLQYVRERCSVRRTSGEISPVCTMYNLGVKV